MAETMPKLCYLSAGRLSREMSNPSRLAVSRLQGMRIALRIALTVRADLYVATGTEHRKKETS